MSTSTRNTILFGGWRLKKTNFIFGVTAVELSVIMAMVAATLIAFTYVRPLAIFLAVGVAISCCLAVRWEGRSIMTILHTEISWRISASKGYGSFVSVASVAGIENRETYDLPGVLATTRPYELTDSIENKQYGVIVKENLVTATWLIHSPSAVLNNSESVQIWVDNWSSFLEKFCTLPVVDHLYVVVSTHNDPACLLATSVKENLDTASPQIAQDLLIDLTKQESNGTPLTDTRLSIVYDLNKTEQRKGKLENKLTEISDSIKLMETSLRQCGLSNISLAKSNELAAILRGTYAPNEKMAIQAASVKKENDGLIWGNCGPNVLTEYRDHVEHNGFYSKAFTWKGAPNQKVPSTVLAPLLKPGKYTKSVKLSFKATPRVVAAKMLENRKQAREAVTIFKRRSFLKETAHERKAENETNEATELEASGEGHHDMTLTATTTAETLEDLAAASASLNNVAVEAKLELRPLTASHGAAVASMLPAGISLVDQAKKRNKAALAETPSS